LKKCPKCKSIKKKKKTYIGKLGSWIKGATMKLIKRISNEGDDEDQEALDLQKIEDLMEEFKTNKCHLCARVFNNENKPYSLFDGCHTLCFVCIRKRTLIYKEEERQVEIECTFDGNHFAHSLGPD
jgi:hypothetical protein